MKLKLYIKSFWFCPFTMGNGNIPNLLKLFLLYLLNVVEPNYDFLLNSVYIQVNVQNTWVYLSRPLNLKLHYSVSFIFNCKTSSMRGIKIYNINITICNIEILLNLKFELSNICNFIK